MTAIPIGTTIIAMTVQTAMQARVVRTVAAILPRGRQAEGEAEYEQGNVSPMGHSVVERELLSRRELSLSPGLDTAHH